MECRDVVYNDGDIFEDVYRYQGNVSEEKGMLDDLGPEFYVPPEAQFDGEATCSFQGTVSDGCGEGSSRDEVRYGGFPFDARVWPELVAKEFDLGTHGGGNIVFLGCVVSHLGRPFHGK